MKKEKLNWSGPAILTAMASRIWEYIAHRKEHGGFSGFDDFLRVRFAMGRRSERHSGCP